MVQKNKAYDRFRAVNAVNKLSSYKDTSSFIANHVSSTIISIGNRIFNVVLTLNNVEGPNDAVLFSYKEDNLQVGQYFIWNNTTFFISEQYQIVHDMNYVKFKVYQCNVIVNDLIPAYFKSTLKSIKDTSFSKNFEGNNNKSLLIMPYNKNIEINNYININKQSWHIVDGDEYTVPHIGYYSLDRSLNSNTTQVISDTNIYQGQCKTFPTENGYFTSNPDATVIARNENSVVAQMPYSAVVVIGTKNDGIVVNQTVELKEV